MNNELKLIKKYYGEETMHVCRDFFPTILEEEGKLFSILDKHFAHDKHMLNNLPFSELEIFKNLIYKVYHEEKQPPVDTHETLEELLDKAGYEFHDCKTQEEILSYKKYYESYESLCTFKDRRLNHYYVSFLVKKDVDKIKRKDFKNPQREDEYGTSVMSVQISRQGSHISIKNRYNHTVDNPDATYGNDLENIIPGLTKAFENFYRIHIDRDNSLNNLVNFINADGKFYRFNYEINDVYYCTNNVIIENHHVIDKFLDKEKYLVFDYFVLDLQKHSTGMSPFQFDDFTRNKITSDGLYWNHDIISRIQIKRDGHLKEVKLYDDVRNSVSTLTLNENNQLIHFHNKGIKDVESFFLMNARFLKSVTFEDARIINPSFLCYSSSINKISLPSSEIIYDNCCANAKDVIEIYLPNVKSIGDNFFENAGHLRKISCPNLISAGNYFLNEAKELKEVDLSLLESAGSFFLAEASSLKSIFLPRLQFINKGFMTSCYQLENIYIPQVIKELSNFDVSLYDVYCLKYIYSPDLYHVITKGYNLMEQRNYTESMRRRYTNMYNYLHSKDEHNDDIAFMRVKKK